MPRHSTPLQAPATANPKPLAPTLSTLRALRSRSKQRLSPFLGRTVLVLLFVLFVCVVYSQLRQDPYILSNVRRFWRRTLHWYLRQLHLNPLITRALSAAVIFFIADLIAQKLATTQLCLNRLARYTTYGMFIMGPLLYFWYSLMNEYGPEDTLTGSLQKCLFDQLTLEPLCIAVYIVYDGVLCSRGWQAIERKFSTSFASLWFKNAIFWMPANFANYYIGTPDLRVIFANLCSVFWQAYFSAKINQATSALSSVSSTAPSIARRTREASTSAKYMPVTNHDRSQQLAESDTELLGHSSSQRNLMV